MNVMKIRQPFISILFVEIRKHSPTFIRSICFSRDTSVPRERMSMRWEVNGDDPPTIESEESSDSDAEMFPERPGDGLHEEDLCMDAERLHEKWEMTPAAQVPQSVKRRLWSELTVDLAMAQAKETVFGWDIKMWSSRKRRRIQELARRAVEQEKTVCAMRCVCIQPAYTMLGM